MIKRMQRRRYLTVLQSAIADGFVSRRPPLVLAVAAVALRGSEEVLTGAEKPPKLTGGISSEVLKLGLLLAITINRSTQIEHVEGGERSGELENAC